MQIKYLKLVFTDLVMQPHDIPKLRGYFANKYKEYPELHNHLPGGKFSYKLPLIQYRIINKNPALIGIGKGFEIIKKILFDSDKITISDKNYSINEKTISVEGVDFGQRKEFFQYRFISPWMALNEDNYKKYGLLNPIEQQQFLKNLMRGNLKTLSKGFNYWIEDFENLQVEGFFKPQLINFKNQKMLCFRGEFTTNFLIPDYLGLGKQSARGFGVVKKIK